MSVWARMRWSKTGLLLRCVCRLLARNGHAAVIATCPLLRDEQTELGSVPRSAYDPKRMFSETGDDHLWPAWRDSALSGLLRAQLTGGAVQLVSPVARPGPRRPDRVRTGAGSAPRLGRVMHGFADDLCDLIGQVARSRRFDHRPKDKTVKST
jgi:hypothetical protein